MAEKDCGEIGLAEKSKPTAREKVRERQIGIDGVAQKILLEHEFKKVGRLINQFL